ncbi:carbamoyltransferase C-terminal domain-containing protein [Methylococcus sp. EFPC2]|uniref:carbamoyltransferase family protein n=1 Tax=Methylococcus sp. EFPC2 TaxID=2812648 RepID=UPI0019670C5C|nr:carbamoyltransferase C-terminal domain-containing protein [Methylococcus sp. EFPC2]QSA95616.1 nodulation protein nolNO [Methylococcus sp. EFPC2]
MSKTYYIGLAVSYHDPALAIVDEAGDVVFAEGAERYLQFKRAINCEPDTLSRLPELLRRYCPDAGRFVIARSWLARRPWYERVAAALGLLKPDGLARPGIKRLRSPLPNYQIHHMMACNRAGIARGGLNLARVLEEWYPGCDRSFRDYAHHAAHAASACYASPHEDAVCAVVDSYGENGSMAFYRYREGRLARLHEARGLGSPGLLYMKLTELCGFDGIAGEEWKVMGLAAYGRLDEELLALFRTLVRVRDLGVVHPQAGFFAALNKLEHKRRRRDEPARKAVDLAHTGQFFFNEIMTELLQGLHERSPCDRLVLAGGCALNSSFNGSILERTPFRELYVPPAPADDGAALGAAWLAWREEHADFAPRGGPLSPYLGSTMEPAALARLALHAGGLHIRHLPDTLCRETARLLGDGKLVGWVQGRAEFGPRALGNRSILADPRDPAMKERINGRVKFREEYRPFAPSILHEHGPDYFENYQKAPYMERALRFRADAIDRVPAVVHADGTGRLQSVEKEWNPRFHELIRAFHGITGVPLLLNTSFNVMGKPIVHTVEDAIAVFMTSGLDALVIEDHLFVKPGVT